MQIKAQLGVTQRRLQEQSEEHHRKIASWKSRAQELGREARRERLLSAERWGEEQAQICTRVAQEKKKLEEDHQGEIRTLREHIQVLEDQAELTSRAEEELLVLQRKLEDKLEEMCVQLEDNTVSMKAQDALIQHLTSELHAKEKEMEIRNEREQKLCDKVSQVEQKLKDERERRQELAKQKEQMLKETERCFMDKLRQLEEEKMKGNEKERELIDIISQLTTELENLRTESATLHEEIEKIQRDRSHLSNKRHLREVEELQENLAKTHEALKNRDDDLSRQASELSAVEMKRDALEESLKQLQTQVNTLSEDCDQMHTLEQNLQSSLCVEQRKTERLQALLNSHQEDSRRLEQENSGYRRLADQLSSQIVEMEDEGNKLKGDFDKLTLELQIKDNQILELGHQLEAKAGEMDLLWNEVQLKMNLFKNVSHLSGQVQVLTEQLEGKERELCSLREETDDATNQLQQSLIDSQLELHQIEEAFQSEKKQMRERLLEMEGLVMALELEVDPECPRRFVVLRLVDDRRNRNKRLTTD